MEREINNIRAYPRELTHEKIKHVYTELHVSHTLTDTAIRYMINTVAEVQVNQPYHDFRGERSIFPELYIANYIVNDIRKNILSKVFIN